MHAALRKLKRRALRYVGGFLFRVLTSVARLLFGSQTVSCAGVTVTIVGSDSWVPGQIAAATKALHWLGSESPKAEEERSLICAHLRELMIVGPDLNPYGNMSFSGSKSVLVCYNAGQTEDPECLFSLMVHYANRIKRNS